MRSHKIRTDLPQPQAPTRKVSHETSRPFDVTFPGQETAASLDQSFPGCSYASWSLPPMVQASPQPAESQITQQQPEVNSRLTWLPFSLYADGKTPAKPPSGPRIQAQLTVGKPNDRYEQEADRVAQQVMTMPEGHPSVQRNMTPEDEEPVQTKLLQRNTLEDEEPIQAKAAPPFHRGGQAGASLENQLHTSKSSGVPLANDVRSFMEPRFGVDFSQVRVHTDGEAVQMNRELGAQAFTHGNHIYYGAGKAPAKDELTGHELTHTIQQGASPRLQGKPTVIQKKGKDKKENKSENEKKATPIEKSLERAGKALHTAGGAALGIEKLYLAFAEDHAIIKTINPGENSRENSIQQTQQLKQQKDQLKQEKKSTKDKTRKSELKAEIEQNKDQRYHLTQYKAYEKLENLDQEKSEAQAAEADALKKRDEAYIVRSYIYSLYLQINQKRKEFPKGSSKKNDQKAQAKVQCATWAEEAANLAASLKQDLGGEEQSGGLKDRKKKLIKEDRMATEATESPAKWIKQKGLKTAKVSAADFALGFATAGTLAVEADSDNRGFIKPPKVTNVVTQAREELTNIKTERNLLKSADLRSAPASFFDVVVAILQGTDRIVLGTIKRILKFLKIYCTILSGVPYAGPIFAAIGTVLTMISGVINLASAAINGLIMLIRGIQAAVADPFVKGVLRASAISAGIDSLTAGVKGVTFAIGEAGVMEQQDHAYLKKGVAVAMPVAKGLTKEIAKEASKTSYKQASGEMKGEREASEEARKQGANWQNVSTDPGSNISDNQTVIDARLGRVKAIADITVNKVPSVSGPMKDTNSKVDETTTKADAGLNEATEVKKPEQKESLESTKESNTVMKDSGSAIKEVLEILK